MSLAEAIRTTQKELLEELRIALGSAWERPRRIHFSIPVAKSRPVECLKSECGWDVPAVPYALRLQVWFPSGTVVEITSPIGSDKRAIRTGKI